MTLSFDGTPYDTDPDFTLTGGSADSFVYLVGNTAVLAGGAYIGAYDDDGVVFEPVKFADDSGLGLGELTTYHVHDNGDGTMNVYYQVRDADPLPTTITNWVVTLDANTGGEIAPATQMTSGVFSRTDQSMLEKAFDLPNGTIAVIQGNATMTSAELIIADADGTELGRSAPVLGANVFEIHGMYDLAVVGDQLVVTWVETAAGAARETFLQVFEMDGTAVGGPVTVSQDVSAGFGVPAGAQIETLSNGNYVVTWVEALSTGEDSDGTSVWYSIFDSHHNVVVGTTLVNENTAGNQDTPILVATESGFIIGYTAFEFSPSFANEGRLVEYDNAGNVIDTIDAAAYPAGGNDFIRIDNNTALLLTHQVQELILPGEESDPVGGDTATDGDDILTGTAGADEISGLGGNDSILGQDGDDTLSGKGGKDTIEGGKGHDEIQGNKGKDKLKGQNGKDTLLGGDGNDKLVGGKGKDRLKGQDGTDTLDGGKGNDKLTGGKKDDVFIFSDGTDKITDFDALSDGEVVDLSDVASITGFNDLKNNHMSQQGNDVVIDDLDGNTLTLLDVNLSDLDKLDFLF